MVFVSGCMSLFSSVMTMLLGMEIFRFFLCAMLLAVVYCLWLLMMKVNKK